MASVAMRSFAGGEIAPALYARTDLVKYATGLRTCRNFLVQRQGGLANRPGTVYVASTKSNGVVRLVKFVFNDEQTYVLEFGNLYVRFFQDGAPVISGSTPYEIVSPYSTAHLSDLQVVQSADVMTIVHPSYAPRELRRLGHTNWAFSVIAIGPEITAPTGLGLSGGVAGTIRYYAVTTVSSSTSEESLPASVSATNRVPDAATPTVVSWTPVTGALEYNVFRSTDGTTYGFIGTGGGTPQSYTDTTWVSTGTITSNTPGVLATSAGQARNDGLVAAAGDRATDGKYRVIATHNLSITGGTSNVSYSTARIYYRRGAETRVLAHTASPLIQVGPGTAAVTIDQTIDIPDNGYTALEIDITVDIILATGATSGTATVTGTSVGWTKGATGFSDTNITPDFTQSPPTQQSLFATAENYPSVVGYSQQRRLFAATNTQPETTWASQPALPANFATSFPGQDDDMVSWTLAGRQVNQVRHLVDLGTLLSLTSNGIYVIEGDSTGILRPTAVNPRRISAHGANALPPVEIGDSALFVQARGTKIRDLRPDAVTGDGYQGNDLTIMAAHLFDGYTISDWDYAEEPNSIVWVVRSDGTLLGLTYIREHDVWGWHRHDTDGVIENVCVVPEGAEDRVYLVVRRTIGGATVRYVERLASRTLGDIKDAIFLDSALSYDGRNTGTETMGLTGGVLWDTGEQLTVTRSVGGFTAGDVGNAIHFTAADGTTLRVTLESYTSGTVMLGRANRTVPPDLRGSTTTNWARAVDTFSGLTHLEGKTVSVFGDGYVVASPNNAAYTTVTVSGGSVTLDGNYAVVHIGLPYTSDMETLDIDAPGGSSIKDKKLLVKTVGLMLEATRGLFLGTKPPTSDTADPIEGLYEMREDEDTADDDAPPSLITDYNEVRTEATFNRNGRVFVRQIDPIPATILAAIPQGQFTATGG